MRAVAIPSFILVLAMLPVVSAETPLLPPTDVRGTYDSMTQTVTLSWSEPPFGGASAYNVYRNGQLLGTTSQTSFMDADLASNVTAYWVTSTSSQGESAASSPVLFIKSEIIVNFLRSVERVTGHPEVVDGVWVICEPVSVEGSQYFPFILWGIHWECIDLR